MTIKEWEKFLLWHKGVKKNVGGYVLLYPHSIKFIKNPSNYTVEQSEKKNEIFFSPDENGFRVTETGLKAKEQKYSNTGPQTPKLEVPYTHIKKLEIYHYNR